MEFGGFELPERKREFECPGLFMPVIGCSEQPVIPRVILPPPPPTHTRTATGTFRPINRTTLWYVTAKTAFTKVTVNSPGGHVHSTPAFQISQASQPGCVFVVNV